MIENVYAILCHRAIDDKNSNNLSLIEAISKLTPTIDPSLANDTFAVQFEFVWASLWANTSDKKKAGLIRGVVQNPTGSELVLGEHPLEIKPNETFKLRINVQGIELSGSGWYRFILRFKPEGAERFTRAATTQLRVEYNIQKGAPMIEVPRLPQ